MTTDIIIGVAGIVLGFVTSYVFYLIQLKRRELCWSIDSASLIKGYSSLFEKLEILYGGQKIENLTVSKIVIWNNGNETIDGKDIAIPPHIYPRDEENTKILDAKIIKTSTLGNGFEILEKSDDSILLFQFDYLDPNQGAVIQIIHTGISVLPFILDGEVKGVKEVEYKSKRLDFASQVPRLFVYFYALAMFVFFGIFLYNFIVLKVTTEFGWTGWIMAVTLFLLVFFIIFDIRQMRNTAKIPKGLSVFEKDDMGIKRRI